MLSDHSPISIRGWRDVSGRRRQDTGIPGQTSWVAPAAGKRMLAVYSSREGDRPGIMAALSEDQGATWDLDKQVCVFDASGRNLIGGSRREGKTGSNTGNTAFGKPCIRPSANGDFLVSFWCTENCVTGGHFCRLTVE